MRLVDHAHQTLQPAIEPGDCAIDATIGNGYDTLFLAQQVGPTGRVFGFDIQDSAIEIAKMILQTNKCLEQTRLLQSSHANLRTDLPSEFHGKVQVAMFNLGYLPHGDKSITTRASTTLRALDQAFEVLKPLGLISILSYRGHPGGKDEYEAVRQWIKSSGQLQVLQHLDPSLPEGTGPVLWIVKKLAT